MLRKHKHKHVLCNDCRFIFEQCVNDIQLFLIFSQRVQSRERRCVKPARKASLSKVSRAHGSFRNSFSKRPSSSAICLIWASWLLWSSCWQVLWTSAFIFNETVCYVVFCVIDTTLTPVHNVCFRYIPRQNLT